VLLKTSAWVLRLLGRSVHSKECTACNQGLLQLAACCLFDSWFVALPTNIHSPHFTLSRSWIDVCFWFSTLQELEYFSQYTDYVAGWTTEVLFPAGIFFATTSRPPVEPTQHPIRMDTGAFSPGVKRPGRKADKSTPSSAEVKNAWRYTSITPHVFMAWC